MTYSGKTVALFLAVAVVCGCAKKEKETGLQAFVTSHVETVEPLQKQAALAWWDAATTGESEAYDRSSELTLQIRKIYSDPAEFEYVKNLKASGQIDDALLARQVTVLYNGYLANQLEPELLEPVSYTHLRAHET